MNLELLLAALLTLAVETAFLALTYRRDAAFLVLCAALNVATNLALNLLLTCLPLNALRAGLVAIMAALFAGAVVLLPQVFYLSPVSGGQWWVLASAAVLAPAIQIGLGALVRRFRRSEVVEHGVTG